MRARRTSFRIHTGPYRGSRRFAIVPATLSLHDHGRTGCGKLRIMSARPVPDPGELLAMLPYAVALGLTVEEASAERVRHGHGGVEDELLPCRPRGLGP